MATHDRNVQKKYSTRMARRAIAETLTRFAFWVLGAYIFLSYLIGTDAPTNQVEKFLALTGCTVVLLAFFGSAFLVVKPLLDYHEQFMKHDSEE